MGVSILILSTAYAVLLSLVEAVDCLTETVYKHNHNKRRRYW